MDNSCHKLRGLTTYLIGPIEDTTDLGVGWRKEIKTLITKFGLNITILDPTHKPKDLVSETQREHDYINQLKKEEKWIELTRFIKKIRRIDLRMVDKSDFLIAYLPSQKRTTGSWHEIINAANQSKPILAIVPDGLKNVTTWAFSLIDYDLMFSTTEQLVEHLVKINNGEYEPDDRWVFIH